MACTCPPQRVKMVSMSADPALAGVDRGVGDLPPVHPVADPGHEHHVRHRDDREQEHHQAGPAGDAGDQPPEERGADHEHGVADQAHTVQTDRLRRDPVGRLAQHRRTPHVSHGQESCRSLRAIGRPRTCAVARGPTAGQRLLQVRAVQTLDPARTFPLPVTTGLVGRANPYPTGRSESTLSSRISRLATAVIGAAALAFSVQPGANAVLAQDDIPTFQEFRAATFQDVGGQYVVNGDEPISSTRRLRDFYDSMVRKQDSGSTSLIVNRVSGADDTWSASQALNLTYCVSTVRR